MTQPAADPSFGKPRVAIVGGGLAGLAAASALCATCDVELLEARRYLGGRAASFRDPVTGDLVDHCQHVGMGCCTNLIDFCRRVGIENGFRRDRVLHFIGPDGEQHDLSATRWLPAPLHLAPALWRLNFLSVRDRCAIARAMWRLMRTAAPDDDSGPVIADGLRSCGQSNEAIERFWSVILVSALGESIDRASWTAARKVLVDGFLASRLAYELLIPTAPIGELYGQRLLEWFSRNGVKVHLGTPVSQCDAAPGERARLIDAAGGEREFDYLVLAVPWRQVGAVLSERLRDALPWIAGLERLESSPISSVHLWYDREITPLPHAVLIGRLSQWVFNHGRRTVPDAAWGEGYYYQVVISASHVLAGQYRHAVVGAVSSELGSIWPQARDARLLHARLVTDPTAVFSVRPGTDRLRPSQRTAVDRVMVAGDWTATEWPATMESAVRSGYLAAEVVLKAMGRPTTCLVPDLPRGALAQCWINDNVLH